MHSDPMYFVSPCMLPFNTHTHTHTHLFVTDITFTVTQVGIILGE